MDHSPLDAIRKWVKSSTSGERVALVEDIRKQIEASPEFREKCLAEADPNIKQVLWVPTLGPQLDAYNCTADILLYGGAAGGGKLQPLDAKILTPFGWKLMGDVAVGDQISDPTNGGVTRVIAVHEHGIMPIYRVTCDDGATTEVGLDHLWAYHIPRVRRPRTKASDQRAYAQCVLGSLGLRDRWNNYRVCTTAELIPLLNRGQRPRIPLSEPVLFSVNGRTGHGSMPAYLAGIMLGDGAFGTMSVSACDDEVRDYLLSIGFSARNEFHTDGKSKAYGAVGEIRKSADAWLRNHGLRHCRSWEKFIPEYVQTASLDYRIEFLRGLMDTDGTIDESGHPNFCSTSERLSRGVADLVRGLGGKATISERDTNTYTYKGEKKHGRVSYGVYIWLPNAAAVFNIKRKKDRCTMSWNGGAENMRAIESIELVREAQARCITVDSPYGLYITDDYIVTHNSDLGLGLAFTKHKNTLILRRQYNDLGAMTERVIQINRTRKGYNGSSPPKLRTADERLIEFGACQRPGDEESFQGRPHDLLVFDEAVQFLEAQVRFLIAWNRSVDPKQRCRVVMASNPPVGVEGEWIIPFFAAWLDPTHHNPAKPGELRWFVTDEDNKDREVESGKPVKVGGKTVKPMSRTFIPAKLADNPFLTSTDSYAAKLDSLPEPYRSAFRDGNFMLARKDAEQQVIPAQWVRDAQARWLPTPPSGVPMCAIGVDVARGGEGETVLAPRHDSWFAPLDAVPGVRTPTGQDVAGLIVARRRDNAFVVIDMGGGYGGSPYDHLKQNLPSDSIGNSPIIAYKGSDGSMARTVDGLLGFFNKRSQTYWQFREALDPSQVGGSPVALPPDPMLVADLTAPTFEVTARGIKVETKEEVVKKLGRSPDRGDAVVMSWSEGNKAMTHALIWGKAHSNVVRMPTVLRHRSVQRDFVRSG